MSIYLIQGKNGMRSEWKTLSKSHDLNAAVQSCRQRMKQKRGRVGTEWFKTRVIDCSNGEQVKVYPFK